MAANADLKEFQERIGYHFKDEALLKRAFTHSSYSNEIRDGSAPDYERLEFLGDAVLELATSDYLYHHYPELKEGELTKKRASMVCETALSYCAKTLSIGKYLFLGKGEDAAGGREHDAIIADVMESVAGAIYLDGGYEPARSFINTYILENQSDLRLFFDAKTTLQEIVQGGQMAPLSYRITGSRGPEHRRIFMCQVLIGDKVMGEGEGTSKKAAEQKAAQAALASLGDMDDK